VDCPIYDREKWSGHMRGFNNKQGGATAFCKLKESRILKERKKKKQERGAVGIPKDVEVKSMRSV
jgi:hypothetical protein